MFDADYHEEAERGVCSACHEECDIVTDTDSDGVDAWVLGSAFQVSDCCGEEIEESDNA